MLLSAIEPATSPGGFAQDPSEDGDRLSSMELIANGLVVGLIFPQVPQGVRVPGIPEVSFDRLSRIFGELAPIYGYRDFQSNPGGEGARISGGESQGQVIIQSGLVQFLDAVPMSAEVSAENALGVIRTVAKHLPLESVLQLGVKWIFAAPAVDGDAKALVLNRLLKITDSDIAELSLGRSIWAGARFHTQGADGQFISTRVEPLEVDLSKLYVECDATFPERPTRVLAEGASGVAQAIADVLKYARGPLWNYLEKQVG